eukprot:g3512.t1
MQSRQELSMNFKPEVNQAEVQFTTSTSGPNMDSRDSISRWNSFDGDIDDDGNKKQSVRSRRRVLRRAKSLFCCFNPSVLIEDEIGDSEVSYKQYNGSLTGAHHHQKPITRVYPSPESCDFFIGPKLREDLSKKTLVLDLDETLVHSTFIITPNHDFVIPVLIDGQTKNVYVQKRPWLDHFLKKVCQKFEVVIFTASVSKYADPLLDCLESTRFVRWRLFREACSIHKGNYVKDLTRLGRELAHTIIIDNSPASYVFQPGNAVPISGFIGDQTDRALLDILPILDELSETGDVREYIKKSLGESTAILAAVDNVSSPSQVEPKNNIKKSS